MVVALIPPVVNPVATQTINLNVSVTPTNSAGTIAPTGTVTLSSSDATATIASCGPLVQAATGNSATAICPVAFSSTDYLPVTVTATYKPDTNFTSGGPISATQAIKNFSLQPSSTAPIIVTPGYTNTTDPFLGTSSIVYLTSVPQRKRLYRSSSRFLQRVFGELTEFQHDGDIAANLRASQCLRRRFFHAQWRRKQQALHPNQRCRHIVQPRTGRAVPGHAERYRSGGDYADTVHKRDRGCA